MGANKTLGERYKEQPINKNKAEERRKLNALKKWIEISKEDFKKIVDTGIEDGNNTCNAYDLAGFIDFRGLSMLASTRINANPDLKSPAKAIWNDLNHWCETQNLSYTIIITDSGIANMFFEFHDYRDKDTRTDNDPADNNCKTLQGAILGLAAVALVMIASFLLISP